MCIRDRHICGRALAARGVPIAADRLDHPALGVPVRADHNVREAALHQCTGVYPGVRDLPAELLRQAVRKSVPGGARHLGATGLHLAVRYGRSTFVPRQPYFNNAPGFRSNLQPGFLGFAYIMTIILMGAKVLPLPRRL